MDAPRELCLLGPEAQAVQALHLALRRTLAERGLLPLWRLHLALPPRLALHAPGCPEQPGPAPLCLLLAADPLHSQEQAGEARIRQALQTLGWAYQVLHRGSTPVLDAALLAMGLAAADPAQQAQRRQAQFDLDRGRVPWRCERCSDAACEHALFTRLTQGQGLQ